MHRGPSAVPPPLASLLEPLEGARLAGEAASSTAGQGWQAPALHAPTPITVATVFDRLGGGGGGSTLRRQRSALSAAPMPVAVEVKRPTAEGRAPAALAAQQRPSAEGRAPAAPAPQPPGEPPAPVAAPAQQQQLAEAAVAVAAVVQQPQVAVEQLHAAASHAHALPQQPLASSRSRVEEPAPARPWGWWLRDGKASAAVDLIADEEEE